MIAELDLTDAQHDQMKSIIDPRRDELQALGDRAHAARESLRASVMADVLTKG